ncbi:D-alanyl-D-alanine carboxypeptidase family protein [Microbacterium atlanticum]|uniref:D-alanyl-D-alanine carboxypeptidase family protein n=1 Tax=Microbacterium atlanticum TaxID=2782168 RepID=UPI001E477BCD|nr:D-alanyl-D-alanine carboxypeptidase [Microbacterium atlanticum]
MTLDDASAPTRRALRARSRVVPGGAPEDPVESGTLTMPTGGAADTSHPGTHTAPEEVTLAPPTIATVPLGGTVATAAPAVPAFDPPETTLAPPPGRVTTEFTPVEQLDSTASPPEGEPVEPAAPDPVATLAGPAGGEAPSASYGTQALAWVDDTALAAASTPPDLVAASVPYVAVEPSLLADPPRDSPLRPGVVVPALVIAGLVGAYSATTLLWPLHAVAPAVTAIEVQPQAAPTAVPVWPAEGSAAQAVAGIPGTLSSSPDPAAIASITKVVTALVVLDEMPLALGEAGPEFRFTGADNSEYWQYRARGESALDVPVGGTLTEYQMLEGMLIGSANNYADRLAENLWPSDAVYASAANEWLRTHGVPGVQVVEPTGMDARNAASPEALITLAQKALAHPVIAEIVAKPTTELPGAGLVENTNELLADPGVVGIKTGTLDEWNLLSAKDVTVGDTTVRLYASVLGQPDDDARLAASRAIYSQLEQELQLRPSVTAGTVAGVVETRWGDEVDVVTTGDAAVILWNGGTGAVTTTYDLGDGREDGDVVGSLTVRGPLDDATVELRLDGDVPDPSPWWRLTHPLDLFGLND